MNEAAWIVESGDATIETVDSTTKFDMGLPMGSFELADQVGIDVGYHVLEYMHEVLGEAYRPCPLLVEKVEAEELGKKTGSGFYDYENGGAEIPTDAIDADVRKRLLAVMANEVAGLAGNDVADAPAIDRAVMLGAGFPDGPAKLADSEGLAELVDVLDDLHEETGEKRYEATDFLREAAEAGSFHGDESADTDGETDGDALAAYDTLNVAVEDRIGHVEIDRPHRMNTISGELLDELSDAIDRLDADDDVRAILLSGAGDRAFSAGADVQSMAAGGADPITAVELSRQGQQTFGKLEESDKPVVAAIDGYCLGGGMELATATDLRVASERSELGQPEHNLGLLPGWGGTQRLARIVGGAREGDHLHRRPLRGGDAGGLRLHQRSRPRRRARRARARAGRVARRRPADRTEVHETRDARRSHRRRGRPRSGGDGLRPRDEHRRPHGGRHGVHGRRRARVRREVRK